VCSSDLRAAAARTNLWILCEFESKNYAALKELVDKHDVDLRRFPDEVIAQLRTYTEEAIAELTASDAPSKKVYASYSAFQSDVSTWAELSEKMYYTSISS
jgi:TRAP-type mannitol/chloroaromatic compound transport system substrate-binding protein